MDLPAIVRSLRHGQRRCQGKYVIQHIGLVVIMSVSGYRLTVHISTLVCCVLEQDTLSALLQSTQL